MTDMAKADKAGPEKTSPEKTEYYSIKRLRWNTLIFTGGKGVNAVLSLLIFSLIAANLSKPEFAVYAGTKAALEGFARSLAVELAGSVGVRVVRPGATRTGMHAKVGMPLEGTDRYPPAQKVAAEIARAVDHGRDATIGFGNRCAAALGRNLAGPLDAAMRRKRR